MFRQGIINYSKLYGDVIEFQITVPQEIDVSSVELSLPKLKYNKAMVVSWINDDSYSIWNNIFSLVNKKWVDNELMSYWDSNDSRVFFTHLNWSFNGDTRTNGYIPNKFLEYTDGAGIPHRYTSSVGTWVEKLGGTRDYQPGIFIPWNSAKEHRYMSDFGYTMVYHDLMEAPTTQEQYDSLLSVESQQFLTLTDRIPKVMAEPNGNHNYITFGKNNPIIQMQTAQNEVVTKAYPFSNNFTLDKNDITVERWFNISDTFIDDFINSVGTILALPEEQRQWLIGSVHRCTKTTDSTIFQSIENLYGASGDDNVWFTTVDEMYEWWFMRNNLVSTKSVSGQTISYKLYVPTNNNFWFKSLSVFLSNITDTTNISVSSSDNCKGTSYAINNGKLMINLDFNEDLETKAEKYVSLYESTLNQFDLEDAQYFVNMLKPGIKESYQSRLDSLNGELTINSLTLNNGLSTTNSRNIVTNIDYSGGIATHYMMSEDINFNGATWVTYTSNPSFTLSTGNGTKIIYVKLKNSYFESLAVNDSIILETVVSEISAVVSLSGELNTIVYDTLTDGTVINYIAVSTSIYYTRKQFQSKTGELVPWYFEQNTTNFYTANSETTGTTTYLGGTAGQQPVFTDGNENTGVYPDKYIAKVWNTTGNCSAGTIKGRLVFTLPVGTYTIKILDCVSQAAAFTEAQRINCFYKVNVNGVSGTPVVAGPSGFTGNTNRQFNAEIDFTVDLENDGNVVLYMYNTANIYYKPGINLVEIIKRS